MKIIYKVKDIQEADRRAIDEGTPAVTLMGRAADGIYRSYEWHGKTLVVIGKGNNGGDGYALASLLKKNGFDVSMMEIETTRTETAQRYYEECKELNIESLPFSSAIFQRFDTIVDCLFGVGFKGTLKDNYRPVVEAINLSNKYVISVDANSGMNLSNGLSDLAVKSNMTISISELKPGYYLNCGKDYTGIIKNIDIGLKTNGKAILLLEEEDVSSLLKPRDNMSNKGDFGYVGIMGGSALYPGAVKLANLGQTAIYSGAGVSKIIVPNAIKDMLYPYVLESTILPVDSIDGHMKYDEQAIDKALNHLKAVSIGMGWGNYVENESILEYILKAKELRVVIDADGLNALSKIDKNILNTTKCDVILTPHAKEFSRLTGLSVEEIQNDPVGAVEDFVSKYSVTLLLKGPTTIVANKEMMYFVNRGCPGMATAGSGDVLSGVLAGVLGYMDCSTVLAVASASYINGVAGEMAQEEYGDIGMVSSDTARCISKVIKKLQK